MNIKESFEKIKRFVQNFFTNKYVNLEDKSDDICVGNCFEKLLLAYCKRNDFVSVKHVLANNENININVEDALGLTPLIVACELNNADMAKFLLDRGAIVNVKSKSGKAPILIACQKNNKVLINHLLMKDRRVINIQDSYGRTPVLIALDNDRIDIVKYLLRYEPNLDIKDNSGRTPLLLASQSKNTYFTGLFLNGESMLPSYSIRNIQKGRNKAYIEK